MKRRLRSRSLRRVKKKVPGNNLKTHFSRKKPKIAKCGNCGKPLNGVPRFRPSKLGKLSKTRKRPDRPYGGNLCSSCSRQVFRDKVFGLK